MRSQRNLKFRVFLENIEEGSFRYFHANEIKTLLYLVCGKDYLVKLKYLIEKTDVIDSFIWIRMATKWSDKLESTCCFNQRPIYDLQVLCSSQTVVEKLQNQLSQLWWDHRTTRWRQPVLFCPLAFHLQGNLRLQENTSKFSNLFIMRKDRLTCPRFHGVHMNNIPVVKQRLHLNSSLYEMDIVDGENIGELARWSVQK